MTPKKLYQFLAVLFIFLLQTLALVGILQDKNHAQASYAISVIVRGQSGDNWLGIRQGINQAAHDLHANITFITLSEENSLLEQKALIQREVAGGAQAIVLSAASSTGLVRSVEEAATQVPIVCIESSIHSDAILSYISANNYEMGVKLAENIITSGIPNGKVLLVGGGEACSSILERRRGLLSVLKAKKIHITEVDKMDALLCSNLQAYNFDAVVTLDSIWLENTATLFQKNHIQGQNLFGIGATNQIAYYMEQNIICATVVQNEFSIGYLGVEKAVDAINRRRIDKIVTVEYRIISKDNMYDTENQRLLFPFGG